METTFIALPSGVFEKIVLDENHPEIVKLQEEITTSFAEDEARPYDWTECLIYPRWPSLWQRKLELLGTRHNTIRESRMTPAQELEQLLKLASARLKDLPSCDEYTRAGDCLRGALQAVQSKKEVPVGK